MSAEQDYVKDAIHPMISAAYEASLIDSYALHFMVASLRAREGTWEQVDFYRYFQQAKQKEPRK